MKKMGRVILKICFVFSFIGLLLGCASFQNQQVAMSTTDYNRVVEKAQNEILLLNIVRASLRRPMYFTTLQDIKGSSSYTLATGNLNLPIGRFGVGPTGSASSGLYSITPNASYSSNPVFDIAVLNNSTDFIKGIFEPLSLETLQFYWDQGWSRALLLNLFVHNIKTEAGQMLKLEVDPVLDEKESNVSNTDQKLLEYISYCKLVSDKGKPDKVGPPMKADQFAHQSLTEIQKAGLKVIEQPNEKEKYQLISEKKQYFFDCRNSIELQDKTKTKLIAINPDKNYTYKDEDYPKYNGDKAEKGDSLTLTLLSPEGILYRLGQIVRHERPGEDPKIKIVLDPTCKKGDTVAKVPLFVAYKVTAPESEPLVSVDYEGIYIIPKLPKYDSDETQCYANNSMHVLSLISLIISKQITAGALPAPTGTVSIIGGTTR